MTGQVLFERFQVVAEMEADEVFRYFAARDEQDSNSPVIVAQLAEKWLGNEAMVTELVDCFERLQTLRKPELVRVRTVIRDRTHGLGVAFEPFGERRLTEAQTAVTPLEVIHTVVEALHAAHGKGIYHGRLRTADLWLTGNALKVTGFGYLPALRQGWRDNSAQVAPELAKGETPDARVDVYALAQLLMNLYPERANAEPLRQALDPAPDQRPRRMREFGVTLEAIWHAKPGAAEGTGGLVPKESNETGGLRPKPPTSTGSLVPKGNVVVDEATARPSGAEVLNPPSPSTGRMEETMPAKGEDELRKLVAERVFNNYCDQQTERELLRTATEKLRLERQDAKIVIEMELERLGIANERRLLEELEAQLHLFTDKDRKLDQKERSDTLQYICKPRPGYTKGLDFQVAERHIIEFCRAHRVKVKVGMFKWEIP